MSSLVNKLDITELLRLVPSSLFNVLLLSILKVDSSIYDTNQDVKNLKDKVRDYLGFQEVEGKLVPKSELDSSAKDETQSLINIYYKSSK